MVLRQSLLYGIGLGTTALILVVGVLGVRQLSLARSEREAIARGQAIYVEHCAACHGATLEGQPDWWTPLPSGRLPAPPHDASGHTWHHSDDVLFRIIKGGLSDVVEDYESDMPSFGGLLSDDEIRAVLAYIKSTWPERERDFQEQVSQQVGDAS